MCAYESEMLLFQLHFYARKRHPGLEFNPEKLQGVLTEWDITSMRQLFDLPAEAKIALTLPLIKPGLDPASANSDDLTVVDEGALAAA